MSIPKYVPPLQRPIDRSLKELFPLETVKTQGEKHVKRETLPVLPGEVGYAGLDKQQVNNLINGKSATGQEAIGSRFALMQSNKAAANKPPNGVILKAADLTKERERELLAANGNKGMLLAYDKFNPDAKPVILVHGITGRAGGMQNIIEHYGKDPDKQLYLYYFDDKSRYLNRSASDLASELEKLRKNHLSNKKPDVTMITHSMGAPLAQGAMNAMADPQWYKDNTKDDNKHWLQKPCADDFGQVRHISLDGPWRGYGEPPISLRTWLPVERSWADMLTNSKYIEDLYAKPLPANFENQHIEADYAAAGIEADGRHVGWQRLNDDDFNSLVEYFRGDEHVLDGHAELSAELKALQHEVDYKLLRPELKQAAQDGTLTRERFMKIMGQGVGFVAGDHSTIIDNPQLLDELDKLEQ